MTMLIAGHETTAAVLTWAVFLLAQVRLYGKSFNEIKIMYCDAKHYLCFASDFRYS